MKAQAAAPEYETKIPLAVREKNADKLKDVQAEIANMAESLVSLSRHLSSGETDVFNRKSSNCWLRLRCYRAST